MKKSKLVTLLITATLAASTLAPQPIWADDPPADPPETASVSVSASSNTLTGYSGGAFTWASVPVNGASYLIDSGTETREVTTDSSGYASVDDIVKVDNYTVTETANPNPSRYGWADSTTEYAAPDGTAHFSYSASRYSIFAQVTNAPGAVIELSAAADIVNVYGETIVASGTVIDTQTAGGSGSVTWSDLPTSAFSGGGFSLYKVSVISLPAGKTMEGIEPVYLSGADGQGEAVWTAGIHTVTVHYVNDEGTQLPGATLALFNNNGDELDRFTTTAEAYQTNDLGLTEGNYSIKVISPAPGYKPAQSEFPFVIGSDSNTEVTVPAEISAAYAAVVDAADGSYISGVRMEVRDSGGALVMSVTSSSTPISLKGLPDGTYTLTQGAAPEGYIKPKDITFKISGGQAETPPILKNDRTYGYIKIQVLQATTKAPISGATFAVYDADGSFLEKVTTGANGTVNTRAYEIGTYKNGVFNGGRKYTIKQTAAPEGYLPYSKEHSVTFNYMDQETPVVYILIRVPNRVKPADDTTSDAAEEEAASSGTAAGTERGVKKVTSSSQENTSEEAAEETPTIKTGGNAQMGDTLHIASYIALGVVAVVGIITLLILKNRKR